MRRLPSWSALALVLLVVGCSPNQPASGGEISFALTGPVAVLDPAQAYDFTTNPVVNEITEGLLRFGPSSDLLPNLAIRWEMADPVTYVYTLRNGVKFHDGSTMTMEDVLFSLERVRNPKTGSPLAWMFSNVQEISSLIDNRLQVRLKTPDPTWKYVFATAAGHVISKKFFLDHEKTFGKPGTGLIGTGPFKFVSWSKDGDIRLKKFPQYWDAKNGPFLDAVLFKALPDAESRKTALLNHEVDATAPVSVSSLEALSQLKEITVQGVNGYSDDWVAFNTGHGPFANADLRRAAVASFDLPDFTVDFIKNTGEASFNRPIGQALWSQAPDEWKAFALSPVGIPYSLDQSKAYFAKAKASPGLAVHLVTDDDPFRLMLAQSLKDSLGKVGFAVTIEKLSADDLTTRQFSGKRDYDIILGGWGADFPDPLGTIQPFLASSNRGEGGSNFADYSNPQVDKLLDQAQKTTDDHQRARNEIEALKLVDTEVPYLFVDHPKVFFAAYSDLIGTTTSPIWYWDSLFRHASVKHAAPGQ